MAYRVLVVRTVDGRKVTTLNHGPFQTREEAERDARVIRSHLPGKASVRVLKIPGT